MQKANFSFEVLIHDDASTDGTDKIIRQYELRYPELIKPIYQTENKYSKGININRTYNYPRARGKYIALCEGDDYWTDPLKLQKQVDFLEANPEYSMCYTQIRTYSQNKERLGKIWGGPKTTFKDLLQGNCIPTLTTITRRNMLLEYVADVDPSRHNWKMGDYPMWLWLSSHGKIHYMPYVSGVYRVLLESVSHSNDISKRIEFILSTLKIRLYFCDKYAPSLKKAVNNQIAIWESIRSLSNGNIKEAFIKFRHANNKTARDFARFIKYLLLRNCYLNHNPEN